MKSILIQLDDSTMQALDRVAPPVQRARAKFLRSAIRQAIAAALEEQTRAAYLQKPDSGADADDWANAEEYRP